MKIDKARGEIFSAKIDNVFPAGSCSLANCGNFSCFHDEVETIPNAIWGNQTRVCKYHIFAIGHRVQLAQYRTLRIEPAAIPMQKSIAKKHPAYCAERQIRSKRQLCRPNTLPHNERDQADNRAKKRSGEETEQYRAPSEKCANRREKFQVATSHRFARDCELARHAGNLRDVIKRQDLAFHTDAVIMKIQRHSPIVVVVDLRLIALEQ